VTRADRRRRRKCCTIHLQHEKACKHMLRNKFSALRPVTPDFRRLQALLHCAILRKHRTE